MADKFVSDGGVTFVDEVNFIGTDAEEILSRLIARFEEYTGEALFPGDERRIFLQGFAYVLADEANHINETGRGNLLRYAEGKELNGIGDLYGNDRLEAEKATVTMAITISEAQKTDIVIPAGTRVTVDGNYIFAIDEAVTFAANTQTLTQNVQATAIEAGTAYNGFTAGQINKMIDSNAYVKGVANIDTSSGGTDVEDDDSYRDRLRLSPFGFSVAGPSESYRAIALSVSNTIADCHVYSPSAGVVEIVVVKDGGTIPDSTDDVLSEILAACSSKDVRPLTDKVQVVPATGVSTALTVTYYVANNDTSVNADILAAVEDYKQWQVGKIGRDINPDYLKKLMIDAGAARVDVTAPVYTALEENEIAQFTATSVTYGGSVNM